MQSALPRSGAVNETILLALTDGDYVLLGYRRREEEPIRREHAIIAHARAHRFPAIGPLPLPDGSTILEHNGRFFSLFPRARGEQRARAALLPSDAAAMGHTLARLQRVLRLLPLDASVRRSFATDRPATPARMDALATIIASRPKVDPMHAFALQRLAAQRAALLNLPADAAIDFDALPQQVIHGDYQQDNLFFAEGRISAVIDWDQTYVAPPAWEALRTMHLNFGFAPATSLPFLAAYQTESPVSLDELDAAARLYDFKVRHDLWLYETFYLDGNGRVRPFLLAARDTPVALEWARLRADALRAEHSDEVSSAG
jgi:homoserine kinase type II